MAFDGDEFFERNTAEKRAFFERQGIRTAPAPLWRWQGFSAKLVKNSRPASEARADPRSAGFQAGPQPHPSAADPQPAAAAPRDFDRHDQKPAAEPAPVAASESAAPASVAADLVTLVQPDADLTPALPLTDPRDEVGVLDAPVSATALEAPASPVAPAASPARARETRAARASRARRAMRVSLWSIALATVGIAALNLSEPVLAMPLGGGHTVRDLLAPHAGIKIIGHGDKPVFASPPNAAPGAGSRGYFTPAERASAQHGTALGLTAVGEDIRALSPRYSVNGLLRVHGTDLAGLARATFRNVTTDRKEGGSTLPVTACSIALGTEKMPTGIVAQLQAKWAEHVCAARLEAESRGDWRLPADLVLNNSSLIVGGVGSNFGPEVRGASLSSTLLFGRNFSELADCELAFEVAAINRPFHVPGKSAKSRDISRKRLGKTIERARGILTQYRQRARVKISDDDIACLATLPNILDRRFRNPAGDLTRAFGDAAPQVRAEAFALRLQRPGLTTVRAAFDPVANEAAMDRVAAAACKIGRDRRLLLDICFPVLMQEKPLAQVRVLAMTRDGLVYRSVALGAGASQSLTERNDGTIPSRGSIIKGPSLPALSPGNFCRRDYPYLEDADGVRGLPRDCRPGEELSPEYAVGHSLNQPFLYNLEHADQAELAKLYATLGFPLASNRDRVLGNHAPALQILVRGYAAITNPSGVGRLPHFVAGSPTAQIDLREIVSSAKLQQTRDWLRAPTQSDGTARAMSATLKAAGYRVEWAKTGSSEAGSGTDERGKHLVAGIVDPTGRSLIVFAEISSASSRAIAHSGGLSTADIAALILAALEA